MINQRQLIVFKLGNEEFGVEIEKVQEVIRPPKITKFPNSPSYIEGTIYLRDSVLPIVDLHRRLGLESIEKTGAERVIVVSTEKGESVGIVVDSVSGITSLAEEAIHPPPLMMANEYIDGIGRVNDRLVILLNTKEILVTEKRRKLVKSKPFKRKLALKRAEIKEG